MFDSDKAKNFLLSKTVWGVAVMAVAIFSDSLGVKLESSVEDIIGIIGAALAIYGRIKAQGAISLLGGLFSKNKTQE